MFRVVPLGQLHFGGDVASIWLVYFRNSEGTLGSFVVVFWRVFGTKLGGV